MTDAQGIATRDFLKSVSGLERPSAIRRWLDRERIPYIVGADHWPHVLGSLIVERMGSPVRMANPEPQLRLRHG